MPNFLGAGVDGSRRPFSGSEDDRYGEKIWKLPFDLSAEHGEHKAFLEVKGVTLEENGIARFPDAPTQRGIRHMRGADGLCKGRV